MKQALRRTSEPAHLWPVGEQENAPGPPQRRRRRKYRNQPVEIDGIKFASKAEGKRYEELRHLLDTGRITELYCHPRYKLEVNGQLIGHYTADFSYLVADSTTPSGLALLVEDVKSPASCTQAYKLRKKLMQALYGITILEIKPHRT